MKKILLAMVLVATACCYSDTPAPRRRRPQGSAKASGGLVMSPAAGKYARIVSAQERVGMEVVSAAARSITLDLWIPVEISSIPARANPREVVSAGFAMPRTGLVVAIVDHEDDVPVIVAPEAGWAIVNVRPLAADNPNQPKLNARTSKEIWRAFAFANGAGFSAAKPCVLQQTLTLSDLDAVTMPVPSPEQHNKLIDCAVARGITPIKLGTYRSACQQGWAPSPTNDVQKAIWEEVRADKERGPTNPITIPPPNQKK